MRISADYQQYSVDSLFAHEKYDKETFENDIALMKVRETFEFSESFRAICLPGLSEFPVPSSGIAVGYGSTDKDLDYSDSLRQVQLPIVSQEDCFDSDFDFYERHLFRGNFCAGEVGKQKGVCSGDSGSGFYVRVNNNWYLQGITSNTKRADSMLNPTCNYASYAIFTNVTFYADWIGEKLTNF